MKNVLKNSKNILRRKQWFKGACVAPNGTMILRFLVSKEGKLPDPKKIQEIVNIPHPRIHDRFKYSMGWYIYRCFIKNFVPIVVPITKLIRKTETFLWTEEC